MHNGDTNNKMIGNKMKLLTKEIEAKLVKQWGGEKTNKPYLKLFNPCGDATWLITEYDPKERVFFGLCDLGFGSPELGYVSLDEILEIDLPFGLKIERDMYWKPEHTIMEYYEMARIRGYINE